MSMLTPPTGITDITPEKASVLSTPNLAKGLPSPVSSLNEAFTRFLNNFPVQSPLPNKREPQVRANDDDPEDNPTLPVWTPRKKCKTFTDANTSKYDELSKAIGDILVPKPTVWGEDIEYLHSDEEPDEERQTEQEPPKEHTDDSVTPSSDGPVIGPCETPLSSTGTPQCRRNNKPLPPLDPGIVRVWSADGRRYAYQFDPSKPKINQDGTYGHIPGLYIGKHWHSRWGAAWDGTHNQIMAGIACSKSGDGVVAIAMNGGYEDDVDEGYRFIYSGSGGRVKPQKGYPVKAGQSKHQDWNRNNSALRQNVINERPVRVLRGSKGNSFWSPEEGFIYCGLYEVVACWVEAGKSGFDVIRFAFKRLPNQDPLVNGKGETVPEPDYEGEEWKGWESRLTRERAEEVVALKKEESPGPEHIAQPTTLHPPIKTEELWE